MATNTRLGKKPSYKDTLSAMGGAGMLQDATQRDVWRTANRMRYSAGTSAQPGEPMPGTWGTGLRPGQAWQAMGEAAMNVPMARFARGPVATGAYNAIRGLGSWFTGDEPPVSVVPGPERMSLSPPQESVGVSGKYIPTRDALSGGQISAMTTAGGGVQQPEIPVGSIKMHHTNESWRALQEANMRPYQEMVESQQITQSRAQASYERRMGEWKNANPSRVPTRVTEDGKVLASRKRTREEIEDAREARREQRADARAAWAAEAESMKGQLAIERTRAQIAQRQMEAVMKLEKDQQDAAREQTKASWDAMNEMAEKTGRDLTPEMYLLYEQFITNGQGRGMAPNAAAAQFFMNMDKYEQTASKSKGKGGAAQVVEGVKQRV